MEYNLAADASLSLRSVTQLPVHVIANFAGQLTVSGIQFLMIPQYVRYLGVDAYGLVGFFLTLQAIFQLLDLGLSPTVNRELARYSAVPGSSAGARDFVRTFEIGYCGGGLLLGAALFAAAPWIQRYWLVNATLPEATVVDALRMMGILTAAQWPLTFYQGGLLGLGRAVAMNVVRVTMTALTAVGALFVLSRISADVGTLFRWQAMASLLYVAIMAGVLWHYLPPSSTPARPRLRFVRSIWRFAAGMTGLAITGLVLTQIDKIVLSRATSLTQFGIYTVAAAIANALYTAIAPMFASIFPRLSSLVAAADVDDVRALYRRSWMMATWLLVPAGVVIGVFSRELLQAWTGNVSLSSAGAPIVTLLVTGTVINGLMNVPYALQLAHAWTSAPLRLNVVLAVLAVPVVIFLARSYGALGVALVWPGANVIYAAVMIPVTHAHFVRETQGRWIVREVPAAIASSIAIVMIVHAFTPSALTRVEAVAAAGLAWALAASVVALLSSELRGELARYLVRS